MNRSTDEREKSKEKTRTLARRPEVTSRRRCNPQTETRNETKRTRKGWQQNQAKWLTSREKPIQPAEIEQQRNQSYTSKGKSKIQNNSMDKYETTVRLHHHTTNLTRSMEEKGGIEEENTNPISSPQIWVTARTAGSRQLKALVWFWWIDETPSANLVYQVIMR